MSRLGDGATSGCRALLVLGGLLLGLLGPAAGVTAQQSSPPSVSVSAPVLSADGAIVTVTWPGATPSSWASAYSDSAFFQSGTGAPPVALTLPYRATASTAWVCVATTCTTFTVPGKPAVLPEPTTHVVSFTEPTTRDCEGRAGPCAALDDLVEIRIYWRVDGGPESMVTVPASGPAGGAAREQTLTIPYTSGTLTVTIAARDRSGRESRRSAPASKVIGAGAPPSKP